MQRNKPWPGFLKGVVVVAANLRATGVELALVKKIVALNLFASAQSVVSPEAWLKSSLVIDFKAFHNDNGTNFAELAGCGVHFSPETLREAQQKKILGSVLPRELQKGEAAVRRLGKLETGLARQFWKAEGR